MRLLQQATRITESISAQLQNDQMYRVVLDGQDEQSEVEWIQNTVLGKVQDSDGTPIKFLSTSSNMINIVAIDVSSNILGAVDVCDCLLAAYGDPYVNEICRKGVFGLFQEDKPEYLPHIHDLAAKYAHIRKTLHGILFLFRKPGTCILAYQLEQFMMWNPALIDNKRAGRIYNEIASAIPPRSTLQ